MYILVSFDSNTRDTVVKKFQTHEHAWDAMKQELLSVHNAEFADDYENDADIDGFVEEALYDYGISKDSAWANCCNDMDCDWSIHEIEPELPDTSDSKDDKVTVFCYGKKETWSSRKEAEAFYLDCMRNSEGSECMRYVRIYTALKAGESVCTDDEF